MRYYIEQKYKKLNRKLRSSLRQSVKSGFVLAAGAALMLTSCNSSFLEEYSQDLARVESVDDLNELLMGDCTLPLGLFSYESYSFSQENLNYMVVHFMGDELQENISAPTDPDEYMNETEKFFPYFTWQRDCYLDKDGSNSLEEDEAEYWDLGYEKIGNCNMVLDAADDMSTSNDEDAAKLRHVKGECHYLRASYYLMLANLYGKPYAPSTAATDLAVPIKTTAKVEDVEFQRNTVQEVYDQVISDLTEAESELADVTTPSTIYHVGINAVYLLRSRVALYMQDWSTAQKYAKLSLEQNSFLQDMRGWSSGYPISASNKEVIYSNGSSCLGNVLFTSPGRESSSYESYSPNYSISDHLVSLYEDNDGRKTGYITNEDDITYGQWSYHKIDNSRASYNIYKDVSDVFSLRSAEAYLNLAEADAHLGEDAEACQMVNTLRNARITDATSISLSGDTLVSFIREERERELCLEGHRWFDLRRYMVDEQYPYTKTIDHTFTIYVYQNYRNLPSETRYYRLEKNDAAYTLNIPKDVRDFQSSIGSNERPDRQPYNVVPRNTSDSGDEDDYDY